MNVHCAGWDMVFSEGWDKHSSYSKMIWFLCEVIQVTNITTTYFQL